MPHTDPLEVLPVPTGHVEEVAALSVEDPPKALVVLHRHPETGAPIKYRWLTRLDALRISDLVRVNHDGTVTRLDSAARKSRKGAGK